MVFPKQAPHAYFLDKMYHSHHTLIKSLMRTNSSSPHGRLQVVSEACPCKNGMLSMPVLGGTGIGVHQSSIRVQ